MTWIPLLLSDPSPCLRFLVLKNLLDQNENEPEIKELHSLRNEDPLVTALLKLQKPNGGWDSFSKISVLSGDPIYTTSLALQRLGYLGFGSEYPAVQKAIEFLLSKQQDDGSWSLNGNKQKDDEEFGYQSMPVQTAIPLLGLMMCGCVKNKQIEMAFNWLDEMRLEDGAWPVGISAGNYGGIAGYRRIAHSRWGCRSNTMTALTCLAYHPQKRKSTIAKRALDLLLGTDMKQRSSLGFFVARLIGLERSIGRITFMARFDIAHLLNLCWRIGASLDDDRVAMFIDFVKNERNLYGLWEYSSQPQATRWITYDLLNSLKKIDINEEWFSLEPKTPFQSYKQKKRTY